MNRSVRAWVIVLLAVLLAASPAHAGLFKKGLAVAVGAAIAKGAPWAIKTLKAAAKDPEKREAVIAHAREYAQKHPEMASKVKGFVEKFEKGRMDDLAQKYFAPPKETPTWIKGGYRSQEKTPVQGGGGMRRRWKDDDGNIYEWDSQHGTVEKYSRSGKHLGEFDAETGERVGEAIRGRVVER